MMKLRMTNGACGHAVADDGLLHQWSLDEASFSTMAKCLWETKEKYG